MQAAKAPDPGDDEPVGLERRVGVGRHGDVGADAGQRALGRAQVARPVVEDDDLLHAAHATHQPMMPLRDSRHADRPPRKGRRWICGQASDLGIRVVDGRSIGYYSYMCSDGSGDALADLESALDRLAAEDLTSMFGPQVLDRTRRLLRAQNRLDAQVARTVREGELTQAAEHDGQTTMRSWLRGHARLSPAAAGKLVRTGRALEHLPAVAAAFADGRLTAEQVAVIAPITRDEHRAAAARRVSTSPRWTRYWPRWPPPGRTASWPRSCTTTWHGSTPTAPNPTPPRAARCRSPGTPTARSPAASTSTPWAGRRCRPCWSRWCRPTGPPGTPAPAPSGSATRSCSGPTTPSPPASCRSCAPSSRTWS